MLSKLFGHPVEWQGFAHWVGWNLMLAIIPVLLGYALLRLLGRGSSRTAVLRWAAGAILFVTWLAFVPNTCYLITEWRHFLDSVVDSNLWLEVNQHSRLIVSAQAFFFALYSGAGLLCFVLSIRPVERLLRRWNIPFAPVALPLFLLISLGVYLGLILRLNSWDLAMHPGHVLQPIAHVGDNRDRVLAIIAFGLLLWGLYEALDIWVDGVMERISRFRGTGKASGARKSPSVRPYKPSRTP